MVDSHDAAPAVVLDTNILVAAGFKRGSASAHIVEAVRDGALRMVWSDETRRESERIIRKIPPLRGMDPAQLFRPSDRVAFVAHPEPFAMIPDPDDRKFAALAHAAGATLITNDEHLLGCRDRLPVTVLTAGAFWEMLSRSRASSDP